MATTSSHVASATLMPGSNDDFEMTERKTPGVFIEESTESHGVVEEIGDGEAGPLDTTKSTHDDQYQMERMGKAHVKLRRVKCLNTR